MTNPAESGAGDGMGRGPSPTGQLRDAKQPPPTNSTGALEALFREAMRIGATSSDLGWRKQQFVREQEARRLALEAEALASTLREENARLREGLERADAALRDYACHGGPDVPCIRSEDQCAAECGKEAGDALLVVTQALTAPSKDQDQ